MEILEYGKNVIFKEAICDSCKTKFRYNNLEVKKFFDVEEYYGNMYATEERWVNCPVCGTKHILEFNISP